MRKSGAFLAVLTFWLLASFPVFAASKQPSKNPTISLDGTWQFALAPTEADAARLAGFYETDYDSSQFRTIPVPSNWALEGFEKPHYGPLDGPASQGFYLHHFTVPADLKDKRVLLHFGGVWDSAEVWLNGKHLGRHDSGYTSFAFDVTRDLHFGSSNVLAVRDRQFTHDTLFDTNDDWTLGGIYRSVWLESMPLHRWIDRVIVQTTFDSHFQNADLNAQIMVGDYRWGADEKGPYTLLLTLSTEKGTEIQKTAVNISGEEGKPTGRESTVVMHVLHPLHWTAETPNLYALRIDLIQDGQIIHTRTVQVGFRQVSTRGGVFRINGQAVKLRGVDRHDEYPDVGRATTPKNWLQDLTMMKAANINFIRTSHYPPAAGFLDLCDRMGMYVDDEDPMGDGGKLADDPSFNGAVMLRSYETVARDRNHPSVILWSIGNENPLTSLHMAAIRTVKGLDPTRPVLMPWHAEEWLPPDIDILAPHYLSAPAYDKLAGSATRPVITTEYNHAFGEDGFGGLEARWKALTRHPAGAGGAIWMWADQGLTVTRNTPSGKKTSLLLNHGGIDGIVSSYREPQRDYWETKAVYAPVYSAINKVEFQPGQASVRIPIENDYDFTDLSTVKISWQLMADGRELSHGTQQIAGQPHATAWLTLPIGEIRKPELAVTYYFQITFDRPDGSEITKRSVELTSAPGTEAPSNAISVPLSVHKGKYVTVQAGKTSFTFNPKTAQLQSVSYGGKSVINQSAITIWRPLNSSEENILQKQGLKDPPNLNDYHTKVLNWHVERTPAGVVIEAKANHIVNEKNSFSATYRYTVGSDGVLRIDYALQPYIQAPWLPYVGVSMDLAPAFSKLHWLGLGPLDTYPNEKMAPILGVWSGNLGNKPALGMKATRWMEIAAPEGIELRIQNSPYVLMENHNFKALGSVEGRPNKNVLPKDPIWILDSKSGSIFRGSFRISCEQNSTLRAKN